jgi:hypothetical protein
MYPILRSHAGKLLLIFIFSAILFPLGAAGIIVPRMDIFTQGVWEDERVKLQSFGDLEIGLEGGVKLGGELSFRLRADDLEALDPVTNPGNLVFKHAAVTIYDLMNLPLDVGYFVGEGDILCEGATFTKLFGTWNFATAYTGYSYFSIDNLYEGITRINGTGIKISSDLGTETLRLQGYTYQDNSLEKGEYTSVIRGLFDTEYLKTEAFISASYPQSTAGTYGAGLMFYYQPSEVGEFFTQIGIPRWDPVNDSFDVDLFYFLFEPRLKFGILSVNMTYLLRPAVYLNQPTGEEGNMDLNINFLLGRPEVTPISGGVESTMKLNTNAGDDPDSNFFNLTVSPYFGAITAGVVWDFKFKVNIVRNESTPMFEGFVGVKAEF